MRLSKLIYLIYIICVFFLCDTIAFAEQAKSLFSVRGIGGAGGTYCAAIALHNPDFMLISCDMGGVYRSLDGGRTWELIPRFQGLSRTHLGPQPIILPHRIYWVTDLKRICFSDDLGKTWKLMPAGQWEKIPQEQQGKNKIISFAVLPHASENLVVSTEHGVWMGRDRKWKIVSLEKGGPAYTFGSTTIVAVGDGKLLTTQNFGETWKPLSPLPSEIVSLAAAETHDGDSILLASVKDHGIYRSIDQGATWEVCKTPYERETVLSIPQGQTTTAYAMQTDNVATQQLLRSRDGGLSWEKTFIMPQHGSVKKKLKDIFIQGNSPNVEPSWVQTLLYWGYYFTKNGLAVSSSEPNTLLATTSGDVYISRDGAENWVPIINNELPPLEPGVPRWETIGLEVTACYGYYLDPHDTNRAYIGFADIGLGRSLDKGKSWSWAAKGSPWRNTFYDLAFDPDIPGRVYAATSNRHEIVNYLGTSGTFPEHRRHHGGVVVSNDYSATWTVPYNQQEKGALPAQVCSSIVLDPDSPLENRTLYASIFGENDSAGIYISKNNGVTWEQTPGQPGVLPNRHLVRLRFHPTNNGLYCLISGYRSKRPNFFNPEGGGLWCSFDQGKTWKHLTAGNRLSRWATSFTFDPHDENTIYITAATPAGGAGVGGIYKTRDGGKNWVQILDDKGAHQLNSKVANYDHFMSVAVHPEIPDLVFSGATLKGLFISNDGGKRWRWCKDFPFNAIQYISFDSQDSDIIYLSTMGAGVWVSSIQDILTKVYSK